MTLSYDAMTGRYSLADLTRGQIRHLFSEIKNNIMTERRHFKIRAKERTTGQIVTPEYIGFKTETEIIEFFGLEEPDIEWYEIIEDTPQKTIIISKNNGTMD